jgi:dUTP pyrophosphatase
MSYRMIEAARRLMCDKFSVLCTIAELNEREERRMKLGVKVKRLNNEAVIPKYAREGDAGFDLIAMEDVIIEPGETKVIPTGLAFEIPPGYEMQIRPRSGVTAKTKLRVQLGTIDSGYRGEIGVIVDNISPAFSGYVKPYLYGIDGNVASGLEHSRKTLFTYIIFKGDRIAQGVLAPIETAHFYPVEELDATARGTSGFGSSGVK